MPNDDCRLGRAWRAVRSAGWRRAAAQVVASRKPGACGPGRELVAVGNRRRGFTLLEILVVVLIITILATIVGVKVSDKPGQARMAAARAQLVTLRTALQLYHMNHSAYPTQDQGLAALVTVPERPPVPANYPAEGYVESAKALTDPWGRPYVYLSPGSTGQPFEVLTYGADGEPDGDGEAADVSTADL